MRFASLGSGSEGNGLVVEAGATRVLIDCGFGIRDAIARMQRIGIEPESITAIVVTHEHSDHVGGVAAFATRFGTAVWLTFGTLAAVGDTFSELPCVHGFTPCVASRSTTSSAAFPVPHDARSRCNSYARWAMAGRRADRSRRQHAHVEANLLLRCAGVECNHDLDMLANGDYPHGEAAHRRAGRASDNGAAADLLSRIDSSRLASHRGPSELHNNRPEPRVRRLRQHCIASWNDWRRRSELASMAGICLKEGTSQGEKAGAVQGQGQDGI